VVYENWRSKTESSFRCQRDFGNLRTYCRPLYPCCWPKHHEMPCLASGCWWQDLDFCRRNRGVV